MSAAPGWPPLPYPPWQETCAALHRWAQIVGKYRLAHTPWVNHAWHATLYVTPRGLTTGPVPDGEVTVAVEFDLCDHQLRVASDRCLTDAVPLAPMSVAEFHARARAAIQAVGGRPHFHGAPNELADATPFEEDTRPRPYDAEAARRFHQVLVRVHRVFARFRTGFLGKVSPVHLFWGALDLAVTRFSGRPAPLHPGGMPHLPDAVAQEAYTHEVASAGFWPGGGGVEAPMFYAYAWPEPDGFRDQAVRPAEARYEGALGEFVLPYEAVRTAADPEATLLAFLQSTYEAAAVCGGWDRAALEGELGRPGVPPALPRQTP